MPNLKNAGCSFTQNFLQAPAAPMLDIICIDFGSNHQ